MTAAKMTMQQYCLKWNNHQPNFISVFSSLLNSESLVDVTLSAEGRHLQAHKLVLSACSSYFQTLFTINPCQHPIVILKDVKFTDLKVMVDFMYYGEVNVSQEQLPHILKTAEMLKIKGLAEVPVESSISRHNSSLERTELVTPGESNWVSEPGQRQSMTPSPCPLSPGSRRKRLRKSSTGSGSGSTERTSEEQVGNEIMLTSPSGTLATVIKPDPGGYVTDTGTTHRIKQHSSDSDVHRSSSHDSVDSEATHQITLQIPQQQDINISHNVESSQTMEMPGPSSSTLQVAGFQWGIVDHHTYPSHYVSCQTNVMHNDMQYVTANNQNPSPTNQPDVKPALNHITNSPPQIMQKRKRSLNPQADENFVRALEAVRFGGIGFCKAARMYGVNNRTLWLEYKKRGYPISRLSIKNRKPENTQQQQIQQPPSPPNQQPQENEVVVSTVNNPIAMISSAFLEGRPVEIAPVLQRSRFFDNGIMNGQPMNLQGLNFEPM